MKKLESFMEKYLTPFAVKLGNIKGLIAIRDGVALAMPLIIGGSIFLIINSFPIPGWPEFLSTILDGKLSAMLNHIVNSTFGLMGLVATFGIGRSMAKQYEVDGTSQESSQPEVIQNIGIRNKILGVDIQHIGDANMGLVGIENIKELSDAIRGKRHTVTRMARSINR